MNTNYYMCIALILVSFMTLIQCMQNRKQILPPDLTSTKQVRRITNEKLYEVLEVITQSKLNELQTMKCMQNPMKCILFLIDDSMWSKDLKTQIEKMFSNQGFRRNLHNQFDSLSDEKKDLLAIKIINLANHVNTENFMGFAWEVLPSNLGNGHPKELFDTFKNIQVEDFQKDINLELSDAFKLHYSSELISIAKRMKNDKNRYSMAFELPDELYDNHAGDIVELAQKMSSPESGQILRLLPPGKPDELAVEILEIMEHVDNPPLRIFSMKTWNAHPDQMLKLLAKIKDENYQSYLITHDISDDFKSSYASQLLDIIKHMTDSRTQYSTVIALPISIYSSHAKEIVAITERLSEGSQKNRVLRTVSQDKAHRTLYHL